MEDRECIIDFIDEGWIRFRDVRKLVYEVLYRDFGVPEDGDWHQAADEDVQVVALCGFKIAGTARLVGHSGDDRLQLRQVAVLPEFQGTGIGRLLVRELEQWARESGAREVWLNARDNAFPFYERLGYQFTGETFISELTKIPHRSMRKSLADSEHAE
ncbi:MAG TPA: GNAT family N-acetyltransferase [Coriobacteriia bacterium]|nr:GNAT family N-acetyltransferase [Coriobacteriia bacterium]